MFALPAEIESGGMKQSFKAKSKEISDSIAVASRTLVWPKNYTVANSEKLIRRLADKIDEHGEFIFDVETGGLKPWRSASKRGDALLCVSFWVKDEGFVVPLEHRMMSCVTEDLFRAHLARFFTDDDFLRTNHNIKFDAHFITQQLGVPVGTLYCDTMVQSQVINPDTGVSHGLKELCAMYGLSADTGNYTKQFGKTAWSYIEPRLAAYYAIKDCELVYKLKIRQDAELEKKPRLKKLFWSLEMPMCNLTYRMERRGLRIDQEYIDTVLKPTVYNGFEAAVEAMRPIIGPYVATDDTLKKVLASPTKLEKVFFGPLKTPEIKFVTLRRAEDGTYTKHSLDKEAIAGLQKTFEPIRLLAEYRKWETVKKLFVDKVDRWTFDDHVHPEMKLIVSTGRMALADPNLQQIPSRMGPLVRNAFIPDDGNVFMSADYSSQEMRILAHYTRDPGLISFFTNPDALDPYSETAFMAAPGDDFKAEGLTRESFRKLAKNIRKATSVYRNFKSLVLGLGFGMRENKYARQVGIPLADAKKNFQYYHTTFPGVKVFQDKCVKTAQQNGFITTLLGRERPLPFILSTTDGGQRGNAERAAMNTPIQGSAADMVKLAAIKCDALIRKRKWPVIIVLLVHDEIVFEMPSVWAKTNPAAIAEIRLTMETALPLRVPIVSSIAFENKWGSEMDVDDLDDLADDLAA